LITLIDNLEIKSQLHYPSSTQVDVRVNNIFCYLLKNLDFNGCDKTLRFKQKYEPNENINFMLYLVKIGFMEVCSINTLSVKFVSEKKPQRADYSSNIDFFINKISFDFCKDSLKYIFKLFVNIKHFFKKMKNILTQNEDIKYESASESEYKQIVEEKIMYHNVELPTHNDDLIEVKEINIQKVYKFDSEIPFNRSSSNRNKNQKKNIHQIFSNKNYRIISPSSSPKNNLIRSNISLTSNKSKNVKYNDLSYNSNDEFNFQSDDCGGERDVKEKHNNLKLNYFIKLIHIKLYSGKHFLFDDVRGFLINLEI